VFAMTSVPVLRPQLPTTEVLAPYLRRIDETRWYSNHGPLLRELEGRLAVYFGVLPDQIAVVANGTVALSAALVAVGARPGSRCLLPSWTYVASAAAAWAANLQPYFVDVSPETWMLDPEVLKQREDLGGVGAVMVVSAFGSPVDRAAWDRFTDETGIPVIIDGAAAFDTVANIQEATPGRSPIAISMHATKVFGIGEGGLLLSTDELTMRRIKQICNFGFWDLPSGQILGYNGKLNEYNAAVGLAMLDQWQARREKFRRLTQSWIDRLSSFPDLELLPNYGKGWISSYCNVVTSEPSGPIITALRDFGVETRRWWQSGVHVQDAYRNFQRDPLPVTESLADRVFGVPFFHDLRDDELEYVVASLRNALITA
jgi:dTDP-4-amino-4,6-dideoxygalactose transaminase